MRTPSKYHLQKRRLRSRRGLSELSQFATVVPLMFLVVLIPLVNLLTIIVFGVVQYLSTNDCASKSATQTDYSSALSNMVQEAYQFQSNGLSQFARMEPEAGFTGCGQDLYIITTNIATGAVTSSEANTPLSSTVDTTANSYELMVKSNYSIQPLISLAAVPFLADVPGLGKPVTLSFTANRIVEHPGGLQSKVAGWNFPVLIVPRTGVGPNETTPPTPSTWRTPNIYQLIAAAGETVVSENVFVVQANNSSWTPAGVTVLPGQKIWVDTQAVGVWNIDPEDGAVNCDANGYPGAIAVSNRLPGPSLSSGALLGQVGQNGTAFLVGDTEYNYQLPTSGTLSMICNDWFCGDNTGAQLVRVIVVQ